MEVTSACRYGIAEIGKLGISSLIVIRDLG